MAIIHLGNQRYEGATADTKPTNVPVGAKFYNYETDEEFEYSGSDWVLTFGPSKNEPLTNKTLDSILNTIPNLGSYNYLVFRVGANYYCRNNKTGLIEITNTSPNTVIQYPLTAGGSAYVQGGHDYVLTTGPSVFFDFPTQNVWAELVISPNARIMVPDGSTATIFRFKNTTTGHCEGNRLFGGFMKENTATPSSNWTGILFESTGTGASKGVFANQVEFIRMWDAGTGIKFNNDSTSTTGFCNFNWIKDSLIYRCKNYFMNFATDTAYIDGANCHHRNIVQNCCFQNGDSSRPTIGINNVFGRGNTFDNVYTADFNSGQLSNGTLSGAIQRGCVIGADSRGTIIEGGTITLINFLDNSSDGSTIIRDWREGSVLGKAHPASVVRSESRKWGYYIAGSSVAGDGLFAGGAATSSPTQTNSLALDTTNGTYGNYATPGSTGGTARIGWAALSCRNFNPYFAAKFYLSHTTNNRVHIGWTSGSTTAVADGTQDPLASIHGVMLVQRASASANTFEIAANNGAANSTFQNTGITVSPGTIYTIEIRGFELTGTVIGSPKFQYSLNAGPWTDITVTLPVAQGGSAKLPASTQTIGPYAGIQTNEGGVHNLRLYALEISQDK